MEQINGGMLEMLKYVAASQMNPAKAVNPSGNTESEFGKLLEKKNNEAAAESASDKGDTGTKETAEKEEVKTEKPETEQEEETCDVAREAACAQIVWMIPQNETVEESVLQTEMGEVTAVGEVAVVSGEAGEMTVVPEETEIELLEQPEEVVGQESVVAAETELTPEQTVETVDQMVETETETETETNTQLAQDDFKVAEKVETDDTNDEAVATEAPLFKNVEAAPIKVAEAPAKAEAPEVEQQVSEKLIHVLESGESRVEIQLNPEALGKVTIELTQNGDGTLSILLNAENAETRGILEKHITTLHETLVDRGQQNVQIEVSRGEESQRQDNQQQDLRDGEGGHQGEQQRREKKDSDDTFLQQLRLGLIGSEERI